MDDHTTKIEPDLKRVVAYFYRLPSGRMPVHEWLRNMDKVDRHAIGWELKRMEYGWPMGMPICRPLGDGLFELRCSISQHRTVRVLFSVDRMQRMVLLHGFIKKTQKTPLQDMRLARQRKLAHEKEM